MRSLPLWLAVTTSTLAGIVPAAAQDAPPPATSAQVADPATGSDDGDIVVTAQFRNQRLQDTPIAITAVTAATLEARGQTSIADIGSFAPNVNLSQATSLNGNGVQAFIRGVGQSSSNFAFEPGVGIYVDDVYYGTTFGANLDLTDLDRVEVLRGPQGTLAGKNSVGGAVRLFSRKPDGEDGGFIEGSYGRFDRLDLRGSANFQIAPDFFARISGVSKRTDGYFRNLDFGCANPSGGLAASPNTARDCVIGTEGGIDTKALRLALRYAPAGSALEINLSADISADDSQPVASKLAYAANPAVRSYVAADPLAGVPFDSRFLTAPGSYTSYASYANGGNYTVFGILPTQVVPGSFNPGRQNSARNYGFAGTVTYRLSDDLSLTSITAYRRAYGTTVIDADGSPLSILTQNNYSEHKQFTQELRLTGQVDRLIDYTIGAFYYDADDRLVQRVQIPPNLFDFLTNDPVTNRSASAFAHAEFHITSGLNLIGGIRYTDDRKTYTFSRRNVDGTLPSGIPLTTNFIVAGLDGLSGTFRGKRVDYRGGLNYRFSDAVMVYAQVSTGFKGGGVNPLPYVADQIQPFDAETLVTYEAGFKTDLFDRAVRLNGSVFRNDYSDLQLQINFCSFSVSTACALTTNGGDARVTGVELETTIQPVGGLTINGSVGYLDFDYTRIDPRTGITAGMKAPFNSEWQASGGIEYAAGLGDHGTLTPRFDLAYLSSFYFNPVNAPLNLVPGRTVANARLSYQSPDKAWEASLSVTNLFDKFYYTGANENVSVYGVASYSVARPREWAVTLRRRF